MKKYFIRLGIILAIAYIFLFLSFSYFNVFDFCFVKIKVPGLASSKENIKKAIRLLKKSDSATYSTFCRSIDTIVESDCRSSEWNLNQKVEGQDSPGCYVKGSKTIYLNPLITRSLGEKEISELLRKYSKLSSDFWASKE